MCIGESFFSFLSLVPCFSYGGGALSLTLRVFKYRSLGSVFFWGHLRMCRYWNGSYSQELPSLLRSRVREDQGTVLERVNLLLVASLLYSGVESGLCWLEY